MLLGKRVENFQNLSAPCVLLVEDEAGYIALVTRVFEDHPGSFDLVVAESLKEARRMLDQRVPDIVIADLRLPDGVGTDLLCKHPEDGLYPIVIMTANGDEATAVEAIKAGALDYIVKSDRTVGEIPRVVQRSLSDWKNTVERKKADQALRNSEKKYRSVFEAAHDSFLIIDGDGFVVDINSAGCRMHGFLREELLGQPAVKLVKPECHEAFLALCKSASSGRDYHTALVGIQKSGERIDIEAHGAPILYEGSPQVLAVLRNITDRKLADKALREKEEQLRKAQKMEAIGHLTAGIAHNFNNLLQGIVFLIELAIEEGGEESASHLRKAKFPISEAVELVNQLNVVAHKDLYVRIKPLKIAKILEDETSMCRQTFDRRIQFRMNLGHEDQLVMGNESQIRQTVLNVLINARDALEGKVSNPLVIDVSLKNVSIKPQDEEYSHRREPGEYACITISDNGIGMDGQTINQVFDPFFTTKPMGRGTGLGLSTSYAIATDHGGWIECDSKLGVGTSVSIYLPWMTSEGELTVVGRLGLGRPQAECSVLIVEDEAITRNYLKRILVNDGYTVYSAEDGDAGLAVFESERNSIKLVLLDLGLPGMRGEQLLVKLRENNPKLTVIVLTGEANPPEELEGVSMVLKKPLDLQNLTRNIRTVMSGF